MLQTAHGAARIMSQGVCNADTLNWGAVRSTDVAALRSVLVTKVSVTTVNRHLCAVRRITEEAHYLEQLSAGEMLQIKRAAKPVRGEVLQAGRALSNAHVQALFGLCEGDSVLQRRNGALVSLLYATGIRCAELSSLGVADYDPGDGRLVVHKGKGRKSRVVFVGAASCRERVRRWLEVRGSTTGCLVTGVSHHDHVMVHRQLCTGQIRRIVRELGVAAKVGRLSPHDLRRTFATQLRRRGVDLELIQKLLGHTSLATTQRYLRRDDDELLAAASKLEDET